METSSLCCTCNVTPAHHSTVSLFCTSRGVLPATCSVCCDKITMCPDIGRICKIVVALASAQVLPNRHLSTHALTQGLALGVTYIKAKFSTLRYLLFGFAFVVVTPIGVAIGIAVGSSYNRCVVELKTSL